MPHLKKLPGASETGEDEKVFVNLQFLRDKLDEDVYSSTRELEKLCQERKELLESLRVANSQSRVQTDTQNVQKIRGLLKCCDEYNKLLVEEKHNQAELQNSIQRTQKKNEELRKRATKRSFKAPNPQMDILENKLEKATIRLNEQLQKNSHLSKDLKKLHREHAKFQGLRSNLEKELQETCEEISNIIDLSTAAYDGRDEIQTKVATVKENVKKEKVQYDLQVEQLKRQISHDKRLYDFMSIKCRDRTNNSLRHRREMQAQQRMRSKSNDLMMAAENAQEVMQLIQKLDKLTIDSIGRNMAAFSESLSEMKAHQRMRKSIDLNMAAENAQETVMQLIQKVDKLTNDSMSGEDNLETFFNKFHQVKDENYSLYYFIHEQKRKFEHLYLEISKTKKLIERLQMENDQQDQEHQATVRQMEEKRRTVEAQTRDYECQAKEIREILDKVNSGVSDLFNKIDLDRVAADDFLGLGVKDSTIMQYLTAVEKKAIDMLALQFNDVEKDPKLVSRMLLGHTAEVQRQSMCFIPEFVWDLKEPPKTQSDEVKPLTSEELRQQVNNRITLKEAELPTRKHKKATPSAKTSRASLHLLPPPERLPDSSLPTKPFKALILKSTLNKLTLGPLQQRSTKLN